MSERALPIARLARAPFLAMLASVGLVIAQPVGAQASSPAPLSSKSREIELKAAWEETSRTGQQGPRRIKLLDQGELALPAGQVFVPAETANRVMAALGNRRLDGRFGLILPIDPKQSWLIDIEWVKEGYVKDGDAKEWQPDAMLENLKVGTEKDNERREAEGIPAIEITGWVEQPTYDGRAHQLIWSLAAKERNAPASEPQTINYNTYALGREGYFSLDLITGSNTIAADKAAVKTVLAGLGYSPGKRYEDFNASTDKVAAYGLAGLIGVVAIKKLGLLAIIGAFILKAWKLAALVIFGGWAALRRRIARLFGRGRAEEEDGYSVEAADETVPSEEEAQPADAGTEGSGAVQTS